jgi:hypothetical protein
MHKITGGQSPQRGPSAGTAVVIGAAVGNGLSYAVLFTCGLVFLWVLVFSGIPANDAYAKAHESTAYLLFAHSLGFACLVPGGVWTAKLSLDSHVRNALWAGVLVSLFAFLANFVPYYVPIPWWSRIASVALPVPAFLLGALLHRHAA